MKQSTLRIFEYKGYIGAVSENKKDGVFLEGVKPEYKDIGVVFSAKNVFISNEAIETIKRTILVEDSNISRSCFELSEEHDAIYAVVGYDKHILSTYNKIFLATDKSDLLALDKFNLIENEVDPEFIDYVDELEKNI